MSYEAFPAVADPDLVGSYDALARAGGGYVWDSVLEYRVWLSPHAGAPDLHSGGDYFHAFVTGEEAVAYSSTAAGASEPLALVLQREYINEPVPGHYEHVRAERVTEWPLTFLSRPRRTAATIPTFMASTAPNRLDVLRGLS